MKIKSFLILFFTLVISCASFSQDSSKTAKHHTATMGHHSKHHHKHHKHMMKEGSKADMKADKKESVIKKTTTQKKVEKTDKKY